MAYYDDDNFTEQVLEGIPCEFCKHLFPFEEIIIHETGCEYDLVRVIESPVLDPFVAQEIKIETPMEAPLQKGEKVLMTSDPIEKKNMVLPKEKTPVLKETPPVKKEIPKREQTVKDNFQEYEVLEDHLLEDEPFTFSSGKNKKKTVEKETPSFKKPPIPILNDNNVKCLTQNDLPDSDNEENESLEKFWKRADIKLMQRLRAMEKKKQTLLF